MMTMESVLVVTELPFGRTVGESERAFGCFRLYLELGEERMWLTVAEKTGVSFYTIKCWAWRYQWKERVKAYYEWAEQNQHQGQGGAEGKEGPPAQRQERIAGERLRRAAERALERFGCEHQARKVGLGEIARTFAAAFRMERPEKGKGAEKPWLTPEEEAAIDREFMAAADRIVAIEEAKEMQNTECKVQNGELREMQSAECKMAKEKSESAGQRREVAETKDAECGMQKENQADQTTNREGQSEDAEALGGNQDGAGTTRDPVSNTGLAGAVALPVGGKKKPSQYTLGRREWVRKKYGYMGM